MCGRTKKRLYDVFCESVEIFQPYWGSFSSERNVDRFRNMGRFKGYLDRETQKPATVHWLNCFGADTVQVIEEEKLRALYKKYIIEFENGYFLKMKDLQLDDESEVDLQLQEELNKALGLI